MSTYYESAEGIAITYERALQELKQHGITDAESLADFDTECWKKHYRPDGTTIWAHHVLNWLGY